MPMTVAGERQAYRSLGWPWPQLSRSIKRLCGAGIPFVVGRWGSLFPLPGTVTIVVGAPLAPPDDLVRASSASLS